MAIYGARVSRSLYDPDIEEAGPPGPGTPDTDPADTAPDGVAPPPTTWWLQSPGGPDFGGLFSPSTLGAPGGARSETHADPWWVAPSRQPDPGWLSSFAHGGSGGDGSAAFPVAPGGAWSPDQLAPADAPRATPTDIGGPTLDGSDDEDDGGAADQATSGSDPGDAASQDQPEPPGLQQPALPDSVGAIPPAAPGVPVNQASDVQPGTPAPANPAPRDLFLPGGLSAASESNGDPGKVSTAKGDPKGGISYGAYQINHANVASFVAHEGAKWPELKGKTPGTPEFAAAWKAVAAKDPVAFLAAQHDYIDRTHLRPQLRQVQRAAGVDVSTHSHALQDVTWSTAVQHGPSTHIVSNAIRRVVGQGIQQSDPRFDHAVINAVYDERGRTRTNGQLVHFPASSANHRGEAARMVDERRRALAELGAERPELGDQ